MTQIAGDGGLLQRPVARTRIPFHPAERIELVIDFSRVRARRADRALQRGGHRRHGVDHALRRRRRRSSEDFLLPRRLRDSEPIPAANARRRWELGLGAAAWQINGKTFDPTRIDARPRLGSTEIWTFVNRSNRVHPMHIHGFLFRMLERTSRPVDLADRLGWKDTVGVMPDETVSVLAWFAPYAGKYVFHCHALEHADKAMMLQIEVVK